MARPFTIEEMSVILASLGAAEGAIREDGHEVFTQVSYRFQDDETPSSVPQFLNVQMRITAGEPVEPATGGGDEPATND